MAVSAHGHALVQKLLPDIAARTETGYLVEVGTTREKLPGQGSTVALAALAAELGLPFITIDVDPANTEQARADLAPYPGAEAVTARGEDFLRSFDKPVVAAYLDAFDIQHGKHSAYRIDRYRLLLGTEITNEGASAMHLACAEALVPRMVPGGLIVIDDTWVDRDGYAGKGGTAVPALLRKGFLIADGTKTAIALRMASDGVRPHKPLHHRAAGRLPRAAGRVVRRVARAARQALKPLRSSFRRWRRETMIRLSYRWSRDGRRSRCGAEAAAEQCRRAVRDHRQRPEPQPDGPVRPSRGPDVRPQPRIPAVPADRRADDLPRLGESIRPRTVGGGDARQPVPEVLRLGQP